MAIESLLMDKSHPFYVWSGLLTPKHIQNMGPALAVFLWCVENTTFEKDTIGYVRGESVVTATDIAQDVGGSRHKIYRQLQRLEQFGYINLEQAGLGGKGWYITVLKSKRWAGKAAKPVSPMQQATNAPVSDVQQEPVSRMQQATNQPVAELQQVHEQPVSPMQQATNAPVSDVQQEPCISYAHENQQPKATNNQRQPESTCSPSGRNLSLDEDTPVNRWLRRYQNHRPGAGHPLGILSDTQIEDSRMRVEDLIGLCGEEKAGELLDKAFSGHPRPVSVNQAVFQCQKKLEGKSEEGASEVTDKPEILNANEQAFEDSYQRASGRIENELSIKVTHMGKPGHRGGISIYGAREGDLAERAKQICDEEGLSDLNLEVF